MTARPNGEHDWLSRKGDLKPKDGIEMSKFKLSCSVTVSAYTEIEAATEEEAIEIGRRREVVIGGPGSGEDPEESWIVEDADGLPCNIVIG